MKETNKSKIEDLNFSRIEKIDYKALYEEEKRKRIQLQARVDQLFNAIIGIDCVTKAVM